MLQLNGIKKYYGNTKAIDGVDLVLAEGEICGVIGQEASGKSTLLKIAAGLVHPDQGVVTLNGVNLRENPYLGKEKIGYVPQHFQLYGKLKVKEYMEFYAGFYNLEGIKKERFIQYLLEEANLYSMKDVYVEKLSVGMSRRLCVAQALLSNPKVLILDEPGNGLDARSKIEFRELLKKLRKKNLTIIVSSHMISELPNYCTSIVVLEKGKILLQGSMDVIAEQMKMEQPLFIQYTAGEEIILSILKKNEHVKRIILTDAGIRAHFDGTEQEEAGLLGELVASGVPVYGFSRDNGNFENNYLNIISGQEEEK